MPENCPFPFRLISGGQTGPERGALEFGLANHLEIAGHCPGGRRAEDGRIPAIFDLQETQSVEYGDAAWQNVRNADATVIFDAGNVRASDGLTAIVLSCAKRSRKPYAMLTRFDAPLQDEIALRSFLRVYHPSILNVSGVRESRSPGLQAHVRTILAAVFSPAEVLTKPQPGESIRMDSIYPTASAAPFTTISQRKR